MREPRDDQTEAIAAVHGISVRHLHRLFRLTGTTLGHWIRRSRLDRCAADMLDESLLAETITHIATRENGLRCSNTASCKKSSRAGISRAARMR